MLKRLVSKNKILCRKYSVLSSNTEVFDGKYTQANKESAKAKQLKKEGKLNETKFLGETKMEKLLTNTLGEKDLDSVNFKDPEVLKHWIADVAVKGPKFQHIRGTDEEEVKPVVVTVTGAAGSIGYSLLPRIATGDMLGPDQPIILKLLEMPQAMKALEGVVMELQDCAFPLLKGIVATSDLKEGFTDADFCLLVGSKPRTKGMERGDLLKANAKSFAQQGRAINHYADPNVLTLVVGNPANTNALVASKNSPNLDPNQYSAMTRLDHDRGLAQIAQKVNCKISDIERFCIWGNHSATQYPDLTNALIKGKWAPSVINDDKWIKNEFIPTVQQRGAAIIEARSKSSAASAANAAIAHMRDWVLGTSGWQSKAVYSTGQNGVEPEVYSSFPVICHGAGKVDVVGDIPFSAESAQKINASVQELLEEKEAVKDLFPAVFKRLTEIPSDEVYSWKWIAETIPKQHIDTLFRDTEYLDAVKNEMISLVPLVGTEPKGLEVAWKSFDWSKLSEQMKDEKFEKLSALQKKRGFNEEDIQRINQVTLKSLENDADLVERKYKKVYYDIEDFTQDNKTDYLELSEADKVKFHMERVCEDGQLSSGGINTKTIVQKLIENIVKNPPKFYFQK